MRSPGLAAFTEMEPTGGAWQPFDDTMLPPSNKVHAESTMVPLLFGCSINYFAGCGIVVVGSIAFVWNLFFSIVQ